MDDNRVENPSTFLGPFAVGLVLAVWGFFGSFTSPQVKWVIFAIGAITLVVAWKKVSNPQLVLKYSLNPRKTVLELINEWKPEPAKLEADYERSLHRFLKSKLRFAKITRQYGAARVKCDLAVDNKAMIEMKAGFRSTSKLQRLIGQVELYRSEWRGKPIFIVLLGETEEDLLHDLQRKFDGESHVHIIVKGIAAPVEDEEEKAQMQAAGK